jgi:hypothetical protein
LRYQYNKNTFKFSKIFQNFSKFKFF